MFLLGGEEICPHWFSIFSCLLWKRRPDPQHLILQDQIKQDQKSNIFKHYPKEGVNRWKDEQMTYISLIWSFNNTVRAERADIYILYFRDSSRPDKTVRHKV